MHEARMGVLARLRMGVLLALTLAPAPLFAAETQAPAAITAPSGEPAQPAAAPGSPATSPSPPSGEGGAPSTQTPPAPPAPPPPAPPPAAPAQPAGQVPAHATPQPTVVLVHSELTDGSSWRKVIPLLEAQGVRAHAVQLPLNSMWADVAVIQRALAIVQGPVILVGHSWGGVVITEAGVDRKVAALVYVAAMAPDVGQSFIDRVRNAPRATGLAKLRTDSSGFVWLEASAFATDFAQDLDARQSRLLAATQAPVFGKVFEERVNNAAWRNLPVWYVLAGHDRMLDPAAQQTEAGRINAQVTTVPASHAVPLSQPEAVVRVIMEAVAKVRGGAGSGHEGGAQPVQPLLPKPDAKSP